MSAKDDTSDVKEDTLCLTFAEEYDQFQQTFVAISLSSTSPAISSAEILIESDIVLFPDDQVCRNFYQISIEI